MITGERGIGKTSMLLYLQAIANGGVEIDGENIKFNFLVVSTDIQSTTTQVGLASKIELGIKRILKDSEPARHYWKQGWDFITRLRSVAGVELSDSESCVDNDTIVEQLAYSLADLANRISSDDVDESIFNSQYDGIVILIDEADNASVELQLGTFCKLLQERLQRNGCGNVMIGLAGLPSLSKVLYKSHPSSLRLFRDLELGRLSQRDVNLVIDWCLEKANKDADVEVKIEDDAKMTLFNLSEGFPHFIQQFGYSAFDQDDDNVIDKTDVESGAFGDSGALNQIGDRYYRSDFYEKIKKESYRQVLRIMSKRLDSWVTRKEILKEHSGTTGTVDNAIKALRDRNIIIDKEGERGTYRLQFKGFAYWISLFASPTKKTKPA